MPERRALPLGHVVTHEIQRHPLDTTKTIERGVVIWSNGHGLQGHMRMFDSDSYVVEKDHGLYIIGNAVGEWTEVPDEEWTTRERVLGAIARWEPPSWGEPGEPPAEIDTFAFAVLAALLPSAARDDIFNEFHYPSGFDELALSVADWMDERLYWKPILVQAMSRLGSGG